MVNNMTSSACTGSYRAPGCSGSCDLRSSVLYFRCLSPHSPNWVLLSISHSAFPACRQAGAFRIPNFPLATPYST
jgi:hypothetical protein